METIAAVNKYVMRIGIMKIWIMGETAPFNRSFDFLSGNDYLQIIGFSGWNVVLPCKAESPPNRTASSAWKYQSKSSPVGQWLLMLVVNKAGLAFKEFPASPFKGRVEVMSGRRLIISNLTLQDSINIMCEIKTGIGETPQRIFYRLIVTQCPSKWRALPKYFISRHCKWITLQR